MDPIVISAIIGGIVTMIASVVSAGSQENTNQTNKTIAEANRTAQAEDNATQRQREDTAMQRAIADYTAAGINPLLAIPGHGASSAVVSAPQNNYQRQNVDYGALLERLNPTDYIKEYYERKAQRQASQQKDEELSLLRKKVEAQDTANRLAEVELEQIKKNYEFYNSYGLPTNATGLPKVMSEGGELLRKFTSYNNQFVGENWLERAGDLALQPVTPIHAPLASVARQVWHAPFNLSRKVKEYFSADARKKRQEARSVRKLARQNRIARDYASRYIDIEYD